MANHLRFGTGGVPLTTAKPTTTNGIKRLRELGLEHMELEFVQSVFITKEKAPEVAQAAQEQDVTLSVHGSYYVNLASADRPKWHAAISRVVQAATIGDLCGAKSVTYHSAFNQGRPQSEVHALVLEGTEEILKEIQPKTTQIRISPELTGKASQYGSIEELVHIVKDLRGKYDKRIGMCIDFAHNFARNNGAYNTYDEVLKMLEMVGKELGAEFFDTMHIHMSAIEYGDKGEKNHLLFLENLKQYKEQGVEVEGIEPHFKALDAKRLLKNTFDWQAVLKALKKVGAGGFVVCESPLLELDALLMQKYWNSL